MACLHSGPLLARLEQSWSEGRPRAAHQACLDASCSSYRKTQMTLSSLVLHVIGFQRGSRLQNLCWVNGAAALKESNHYTFSGIAALRLQARGSRRIVQCSVLSKPTATTAPLPEGATKDDAEYMRMCVQLAKKALGQTSPNPMVGCVIVKDGVIVGQGYHPKAGEPHAEVFALREAGKMAEGATAYVSLEPCNHYGRTPPCSQALVKAQLSRVVVGMIDPNPQVAGKGVQTLQKAGIEVVVGVEEALCQATNEAFIHCMRTNQPFVTLRYSMSLDGGILGSGAVSSMGSKYSRLLQENDAVVVTDAAVYDDPILLSSEAGAKQPLRVILARSLDLPLESHVFDTSHAPTLVLADQSALVEDVQGYSRQVGQSMEYRLRARGVDVVTMKELSLDHVLDACYQRGACSVLLDSRGPDLSGLESFLAQQALKEEIAHKLVVNISPTILGDRRTRPGFGVENDLIKLEKVSTRVSGRDVVIEAYFHK